ncbi:hypothetical protein [Flagellimonas sp. S3867]|uniref:hypothetical protein n=1 Tax=Flagellimonas sp. S3867 TaxID=2768063 RepID=UPI001684C82F|nr:hypothetical protein [Flagellimonas sp. S3867]
MGKDEKDNFKTPEGYFDSLHDRLMDKINQQETGTEDSIIPKSDGFTVPEGYFGHLPKKIFSKIDQKEPKVIQLKSYKKFYYGAAAIAAVFLLIFGLNWKTETPIAFEDLASAEIDAYFENTELDFSFYELAEVVAIDNLSFNDVLEDQLEDENILEYLDENVEHIEDLNLDYDDYE